MVKSYCLRQRKQTECVPGSEKIVRAKNGRLMMECVCAECGLVKSRFVTAAFADRITNPGEYKNLPKKLVMPNIFEGSNKDFFINKSAREAINKIQTKQMEDEMKAERRRRNNARARARRQQTSILNLDLKNPKLVKSLVGKRMPKGIDSNQTKADRKIFEAILDMERAEKERGKRIAKKLLPVPSRLGEDRIREVMDDFNLNVAGIINKIQDKKYENILRKMEAAKKPVSKSKRQSFIRDLSTADINPNLDRKYQAVVNKMLQTRYNKLIKNQGN